MSVLEEFVDYEVLKKEIKLVKEATIGVKVVSLVHTSLITGIIMWIMFRS